MQLQTASRKQVKIKMNIAFKFKSNLLNPCNLYNIKRTLDVKRIKFRSGFD